MINKIIKSILLFFLLFLNLINCQFSDDPGQIEKTCKSKIESEQTLQLSENEIVNIKLSQIFEFDNDQDISVDQPIILNVLEQVWSQRHDVKNILSLQFYKTTKNYFKTKILIVGVLKYTLYDYLQNEVQISEENNFNLPIQFGFLIENIKLVFYTKDSIIINNFHYNWNSTEVKNDFNWIYDGILQNQCLLIEQLDSDIYCFSKNSFEKYQFTKDPIQGSRRLFVLVYQFLFNYFNCFLFQNISKVKIYSNKKLVIAEDQTLAIISLDEKIQEIKCHFFSKTIIAFDYDMETGSFALVFPFSIRYKNYEIQLNFIIDCKSKEIFILKTYILFRCENVIQIYTKTLEFIKEDFFENSFQLLTDQESDGFFFSDQNFIKKFIIKKESEIRVSASTFNQQSQSKYIIVSKETESNKCLINMQIELIHKQKFQNFIQKLDTNQFITTLNELDNKIEVCKNANGKKLIKNIFKLLYKIDPNDFNFFKSYKFPLSKTWIIYINKINILNIYGCENNCQLIFKIENFFPIEYNQFQVEYRLDKQITYFIICSPKKCLLLQFEPQQPTKSEVLFLNDEISNFIISQKSILFLQNKQIYSLQLENLNAELKPIEDLPNMDYIFATTEKDNYYFSFFQKTLSIYFNSQPTKTIKLIFQKQYHIFFLEIKIIIFQDYFVFIGKINNQDYICEIFNYENHLNIYFQKTIDITYFRNINLEEIQSNYYTNMLYIFGYLNKFENKVLLGLKVDSIVAESIQFIAKLGNENVLTVIEDSVITFKHDQYYQSLIFYQNKKENKKIFSRKQICFLEFHSLSDEFPQFDLEIEKSIEEEEQLSQFQFPSEFVATSVVGELMIFGLQKLYAHKKVINDQYFDL